MHDLLLTRNGVSAPASHPLRVAVERHRTRLHAELTRARVQRGFSTLEELRRHLNDKKVTRPRWVRINTLKTTLAEQLQTTFSEYESLARPEDVVNATKSLYIDQNVPSLLAIPLTVDIIKTRAYQEGLIILQDKASCFPAHLLDPDTTDICLDACAAPGNKTTHLAAILCEKGADSVIYACDRDRERSKLLQSMVEKAGADAYVKLLAGQDFLGIDPTMQPWCNVNALLLDPSCSGSGIIGRGEPTEQGQNKEHERLEALSKFQLRLLRHAFGFPKARKITYSTCSVHAQENEDVVVKALAHSDDEELGWRIVRREEQIEGMRAWPLRGDPAFPTQLSEACIRCRKDSPEGTQGFFVAAFSRDELEHLQEWEGFPD